MSKKEKSSFMNPTKRTLWIVTVIWVLGVTLLVLGTTDLFTKNLTGQVKALITGSFAAVSGLYIRYFNQQNSATEDSKA